MKLAKAANINDIDNLVKAAAIGVTALISAARNGVAINETSSQSAIEA